MELKELLPPETSLDFVNTLKDQILQSPKTPTPASKLQEIFMTSGTSPWLGWPTREQTTGQVHQQASTSSSFQI